MAKNAHYKVTVQTRHVIRFSEIDCDGDPDKYARENYDDLGSKTEVTSVHIERIQQ